MKQDKPTWFSVAVLALAVIGAVFGTVQIATGHASKWLGFVFGVAISLSVILELTTVVLKRRIATFQERQAEMGQALDKRISCNVGNCDGVALSDEEMELHLKLWHTGKWGSEPGREQSKPGPY